MGGNYDVSKLLQTLIQLEQAGYEFYTAVASQMKDSKAKKVFESLAKDERNHEKIYTELLNKLENENKREYMVEDEKYIDLIISTNFFVTNKELVEKAKKSYAKEDALAIAEQLEKDTILFLNELRQINEDLDTDEVRFALAEEKRHLKTILDREFNASLPLLGL